MMAFLILLCRKTMVSFRSAEFIENLLKNKKLPETQDFSSNSNNDDFISYLNKFNDIENSNAISNVPNKNLTSSVLELTKFQENMVFFPHLCNPLELRC